MYFIPAVHIGMEAEWHAGADLGGQGHQWTLKNLLLICYCCYKQHENYIIQ